MSQTELNISDIIQIIGIIATSLTAIIAIIISVVSLKQNSKMIRESSRGYITIYSATTDWSSLNNYLIIKNFGKSAAEITKFQSNYDLLKISHIKDYPPFYEIVGTSLVPNETIRYSINLNRRPEDLHKINLYIEYKTLGKTYSESISINIDAQCKVVYLRTNPQEPLKGIAQALQDISEKLL